ncbi:MAG: hypothetical protein M3478_04720, partial [Planctomycetota bacterium]|nr:hypothetical protein [Planctomycetota bacterium]
MKPWIKGAAALGGAAIVLTTIALVASISGDDDDDAPLSSTSTIAAPAAMAAARDEASSRSPAETVANDAKPASRPQLADLGQPTTNPAACAHLRDRAAVLIKEFQPKITPEDRAGLAAAMQDVQARGQGKAAGYSAFAGGEMLTGNLTAAAWGGLQALLLEWRPDFVVNAGVYLYHLERLDDAESFLTCARELDPRSPFVIEALALVALKRNDCARAAALIDLAVPLLPNDMNVRYSAAVIHHTCGNRVKAAQHIEAAERLKPDDPDVKRAMLIITPAAAADRARQRDALDRLVEECFAFFDEMTARGELASEYYNLIRRELHPGALEDDDHALTLLREGIDRARFAINTSLQQARDTRFGPPDPYRWNQTVSACADAYSEALSDYEQIFSGTGMAAMLIMGSAYNIEPVVFARKFHRGRGNDLAYVLLDDDTTFEETLEPINDRMHRCFQASNDSATSRACERAFCAEGVPVWRTYRDAVLANARTAEAGYPSAAEDYGTYWVAQTRRVAAFSSRAIAIIKPTPLTKEAAQQQAEGINTMTQIRINGIIEMTTIPLSQTYASLQIALDEAPKAVMAAADGPPRGKYRLCPQDGSPAVNMDEELDPFLAALKAATTVEYGMGLDCEVKIGGVGFSVKAKSFDDAQVGVSKKIGNVGVSGNIN